MEQVAYDEFELLKKIDSGIGPRMRDGSYKVTSAEEYEILKKLEEKDLIYVYRSNGILSGFPFVAVVLSPSGKKIMEVAN